MGRSNGDGAAAEAQLTPQGITEHLSRKVFSFDRPFALALAGLGLLFLLGIIGFTVRAVGDGFSDDGRSAWGYYAAMFGFLLVTAGSAPLVAVGFRWTRNHWRRPLSRASEMFALVGLFNILWFIPMLILLPDIDLNGDNMLSVGEDRRTIWFEVPMGAPIWWDATSGGLPGVVRAGHPVGLGPPRPGRCGPARGRVACPASCRGWRWVGRGLSTTGSCRGHLWQFWAPSTLCSWYWCIPLSASILPCPWCPAGGTPSSLHTTSLTGIQAGGGTVLVTMFIMRTWGGYRQYLGLDSFWSFSQDPAGTLPALGILLVLGVHDLLVWAGPHGAERDQAGNV